MRPLTLASVHVLGARKPHGTRLRYMAGCKCVPCRAANSRYETTRLAARKIGLWNGLVSAKRARDHILKLSRAGVGRRTVGKLTGISDSVLMKIRSGRRSQIRALTERRILEVSHRAVRGSTLVPAGATWQKIEWLIDEGFTKGRIAIEIGKKTRALQLNRTFVTAANAKKVDDLWRRYQ